MKTINFITSLYLTIFQILIIQSSFSWNSEKIQQGEEKGRQRALSEETLAPRDWA